MEFLGVGYQEILVILAIMLVVVGPERLPTMAYQIGRAVRTLQQYARAVRDEFKDEFDYIDEQMKVVKGGVADVQKSLREGDRELRRDLESIAPANIDLGLDEKPSNVLPFGMPPVVSGNGTEEDRASVESAPAATEGTVGPVGPAEPEPETPKEPLVF